MSFKVVDLITGKTAQERQKDRYAYAEIKRLKQDEFFRARKEDALREAREESHIMTNRRISAMKKV